jgi:hypothetical protein
LDRVDRLLGDPLRRIKPQYVGIQKLPAEGTIEVSYRVTGDESLDRD